jgi:hypothetical protein
MGQCMTRPNEMELVRRVIVKAARRYGMTGDSVCNNLASVFSITQPQAVELCSDYGVDPVSGEGIELSKEAV